MLFLDATNSQFVRVKMFSATRLEAANARIRQQVTPVALLQVKFRVYLLGSLPVVRVDGIGEDRKITRTSLRPSWREF